MTEVVADCPRCGASKVTFGVYAANLVNVTYGWRGVWEVFGVCRHCRKSTVHVAEQRTIKDHLKGLGSSAEFLQYVTSVNLDFEVERYISLSDRNLEPPPDHLPDDIKAAYKEGSRCLSVECFNAAGTMFRLCVDLATKSLLPEGDEPPYKVRRDLGLRLPWLFKNKLLSEGLEPLSHCIQQDGNDGAHAGTLKQADAEDLRDFTFELLEQLYTVPQRVVLAEQRRQERRAKV